MAEIYATRLGDALHPKTAKDRAQVEKLTERQTVKLKVVRERSSKHHRFYFKVIAAAFNQWPDPHEFQPEDPDHLRQWLQCKAGYTHHMDFPAGDNPQLVADIVCAFAAQIAEERHVFPRICGDTVRLYWAKSIAWAQLSQTQFKDVARPVFEIVESVVGVEVERLATDNAKAA